MAHNSRLKYVVLADDDEDDCFIFTSVIKELNDSIHLDCYQTCTMLLQQLDDLNLPDIIFLDLNIPPMDGQTCLVEIKKKPQCQTLPVIIYSTSSAQIAIDQAYKNGASSYIVKPNSEIKLKEIVREIFKVM